MRLIKVFALSILMFLGAFTGAALASTSAASDDAFSLEMLRPIYEAFTSGKQLYAGFLALIFAIAALKRYAPGKVKTWMQTDVGGTLTTLLLSFATAMTASLAGGAGITLAMLKNAFYVAAGAAGGYTMVRRLLIEPILKPLAAKAPAWAKPIFKVMFWLFDKPSPTEKAEVAGAEAVKANPAKGASNVVNIRDVE